VQPGATETFWHHRYDGSNLLAIRSDLVTTLDDFETEDIGVPLFIECMAWHQGTDMLYAHGFHVDSRNWYLLEVDTEAEPDRINRTHVVDRQLRGLASDGTDLWAIVQLATTTICRIDPSTGTAIETFDVPDERLFWRGLALGDDGRMYAISQDHDTPDGSEAGVVYVLDPTPEMGLP